MELRSTQEILRDLARIVPKDYLATRKQGGQTLTYIPWHCVVNLLDAQAPGWVWEVKSINQVGGRLVLVGRLSIPTAEGLIYREATGQESLELSGYGDPSSNAESMAFRRAAAKFGLGLWLYDKANHSGDSPRQTGTLPQGQLTREQWLERKQLAAR